MRYKALVNIGGMKMWMTCKQKSDLSGMDVEKWVKIKEAEK